MPSPYSEEKNHVNLSSSVGFLSASFGFVAERMDFNKLKIRILSIVSSGTELNSSQIREKLVSEGLRDHREKALEMALLRYARQGLLSRKRRGRWFYYQLTERGEARKKWLLQTSKRSSLNPE